MYDGCRRCRSVLWARWERVGDVDVEVDVGGVWESSADGRGNDDGRWERECGRRRLGDGWMQWTEEAEKGFRQQRCPWLGGGEQQHHGQELLEIGREMMVNG